MHQYCFYTFNIWILQKFGPFRLRFPTSAGTRVPYTRSSEPSDTFISDKEKRAFPIACRFTCRCKSLNKYQIMTHWRKHGSSTVSIVKAVRASPGCCFCFLNNLVILPGLRPFFFSSEWSRFTIFNSGWNIAINTWKTAVLDLMEASQGLNA